MRLAYQAVRRESDTAVDVGEVGWDGSQRLSAMWDGRADKDVTLVRSYSWTSRTRQVHHWIC